MTNIISSIVEVIATSPWSLLLIPILVIFYLNYKTLSKHKEYPESFAMLIACLREDRFGKFYRTLLGAVLDKLDDWLGDKTKPHYTFNQETGPQLSVYNRFFSSNPFTPQSYEFLIRLAFVYPILAFLITWARADGSIAGIHWLEKAFADFPEGAARWQMIVFAFVLPVILGLWLKHQSIKFQGLILLGLSLLAGLLGFYEAVVFFWLVFFLLFIPLYGAGDIVAWLWQRDRRKAHHVIYPFAFAFAVVVAVAGGAGGAVAFAVAVTGAGAVAVAFAFAGVGAVAGAFAGAGAGAGAFVGVGVVAVAGAGAFAGAFFVIYTALLKYSTHKQKAGLFWLIYSLIFIALAVVMINNTSDRGGIFLLFYLLFPLLNAPIDWLSLAITRGLLQSIRSEHHGGWYGFAWALLDVILAVFFLLLVSAILVLAMGWVNPDFLQQTLSDLSQDGGSKNYYWVYAMLLTTLIPTLLHFALAASALTLWLPHTWRHRIADNLQANYLKLLAATGYLTITPIIGILAPIVLLYGLYKLLIEHGGLLGEGLLSWANWLAAAIQ